MSYKKINLISLDTETLGLEDPNNSHNQIIEFGAVAGTIIIEDGNVELEVLDNNFHTFVKCPSFEVLKHNLHPWVIKNNESLIRDACFQGVDDETFADKFESYLCDVKSDVFGESPVEYLCKSMQSLDAPIMTKHLGWDFMQRWGLNRKKIDVQDAARFLIHQGRLPLTSASSKTLVEYFGMKEDVNHTAIEDSIDMLKIYTELLKL